MRFESFVENEMIQSKLMFLRVKVSRPYRDFRVFMSKNVMLCQLKLCLSIKCQDWSYLFKVVNSQNLIFFQRV